MCAYDKNDMMDMQDMIRDRDDEEETMRDRAERRDQELRYYRMDEEREDEIGRETSILLAQCTDIELAEKYVDDHIPNTYRMAAEFFNLAALYHDDTAQLGFLVRNIVNNRLRKSATFIVNERNKNNKD